MKPQIHRESMKSIVIKVGQSLKFDVPVSGEPPPEKIWMLNDKPIEGDGHITVSLNLTKINVGSRRIRSRNEKLYGTSQKTHQDYMI